MGDFGGTSIGGATGPGGSNRSPISEGWGHEITIGGPSTPARRAGRSVASTAAAHAPACTSTDTVPPVFDAVSRSNMEIPRGSSLHPDGIRPLRWGGPRGANLL